MKKNLLNYLILACLCTLATFTGRAENESALIGILQSSAGVPEKCAACQKLRVIGTAKAVPALATLLGEERISHAARYALEAMPYPEAGAALRKALGETSGPNKAGIVDSLGWRRDATCVPLLTPLLSQDDTMIVTAAATALGRIGGQEAIAALSSARDQASATVQAPILEGLLRCAEQLFLAGDGYGAANLYHNLGDPKVAPPIRAAAWRGLALADPDHRGELFLQALTGADAPVKSAAVTLLRELNDANLIKAVLLQWHSLPEEAQIAVLDAHLKFGSGALSTARTASQSPRLAVRLAAWQALAKLNDAASIPTLARVAAQGEPAEREVVRETLARLHGPGVRGVFLSQINSAEPALKAELLRALGERGDTAATSALLKNANDPAEPVRLAALESLRKLAVPETLKPLLDLAAKAQTAARLEPVLKALYAVCQASPDKEQTAGNVIAAIERFSAAERRSLLPLLAELGTGSALETTQAALRDSDAETVKEAVRVLTQWPTAAPALKLLEFARASTDPTVQTLALRGSIEVIGQEPDAAKRLPVLQQAMAAAKRAEEKKQALGQIGQIPTPEALELVLKDLTDPDLVNEAGLAAVSIAEKLVKTDPQLARETAAKVLAQCKSSDVIKRAMALRGKSASAGPFIQDWLVCGPYRQAGVVGAEALFNVPFDPEKPRANVSWKSVPRAEQVNLTALFPGQDHCVAYLKARVIAPEDGHAVLLLGSDDGVKAWFNSAVVHSQNVDRGLVVDQDVAPIQLKQGANELLLKVTQGGGGWAVCARIAGINGLPINGLRVESQAGTAPAVAVSTPKPAPIPKSANLPKHDAFQTHRLSDQFYAEGAYYGDFNRDGKLDVVAGPFWFAGPDFQKRFEYRPGKTYDPKEYSDNFLTFAGDFNGDGWTDILCVPFPGKECYWYENPAGKEGHWKQHLAYDKVGNESPLWGDVTGDGRPELIFCNDGYYGYASPDPAHPDQPWAFRAVSTKDKRFFHYTHGAGLGDLNGDKRADLIEATGWWEQPAEPQPDQPWKFHPFRFAEAGAQMLVYDVNGDGLSDVITAWHCHLYGLVWWQQLKNDRGQPDWKQHVILSPTPDVTTTDFRVSQLHALELVDMNGDGIKDILTGKRYWAHGPTGDKEPDAPPVVFWLELRRDGQGNATFLPHLIDDNSGVGTQVASADLNQDGRPDVIVGNKKGIFVHLSQSQ